MIQLVNGSQVPVVDQKLVELFQVVCLKFVFALVFGKEAGRFRLWRLWLVVSLRLHWNVKGILLSLVFLLILLEYVALLCVYRLPIDFILPFSLLCLLIRQGSILLLWAANVVCAWLLLLANLVRPFLFLGKGAGLH